MKNILCVSALCAIMPAVFAQKTIDKHLDFSGKKMVSMNLEIADSIRIITWNKQEVYVKGSININNDKNDDAYVVNFNEGGSEVRIHSKFANGWHGCCGDSGSCCNCNCHEKIYFEVFVPEN